MSSTATRRPPNAMNFIRQLEILKKSGEESDFTADRLLFFFMRIQFMSWAGRPPEASSQKHKGRTKVAYDIAEQLNYMYV